MENLVEAPKGKLIDGKFYFPARVYYEDTDAGGVVYYANYLKFAERARTEFVRMLGINQHDGLETEDKCGFMVRGLNIEYKAPAILDDLLAISCEVLSLSGARMEVKQEIFCKDRLLVSLTVQLAYVSLNCKRPIRIPEELVKRMEQLLNTNKLEKI